MDTKNKKLRLNKETIRNLSDDSLSKVGGGDGSGGGDSNVCTGVTICNSVVCNSGICNSGVACDTAIVCTLAVICL